MHRKIGGSSSAKIRAPFFLFAIPAMPAKENIPISDQVNIALRLKRFTQFAS